MEKVIPVPGSGDKLLLLGYSDADVSSRDANLVRVRTDGSIVWRSAPPDDDPDAADAWVAARLQKRGTLTANSWSCYLCEIDLDSGAIISATFTK